MDEALVTETESLSHSVDITGGSVPCFIVNAVDENGTVGPPSNEECGEALFPAPENFSGSVSQNNISLSWAIVENASSYLLKRDGADIYSGTDLSYEDTELDYGTAYTYTISTVNVSGESGPESSELELTTGPFLIMEIEVSLFNLNWISVPAAQTYRIYLDDVFNAETADLSYSISLSGGTEHCFKVTAVFGDGTEGPESNEECGEALFPAPENFSGSITDNNVTLTWSTVENASTYSLKRDGTEIYAGSDLSYEDTGLDSGTYNYTISSVNGSGVSGPESTPLEIIIP